MQEEYAIEVQNLTKKFGDKKAVNNVSLKVKKGEVFGLLGPNGAGKTTTLKLITTLLKLDGGSVHIFGHDISKESQLVRSMFGLTGQYASVDEDLSGRQNLMLFSRLNGLSRSEAKKRAYELLEEFSLVDAADKAIKDFSGGMRRRLDLAVSLIASPKLIFLDEPTTGLDPRTRTQMWDTIRNLVKNGSTIVLTTQYLEEADELADRIGVIDNGHLVSIGTPSELKKSVGNSSLKLQLINEADLSQTQTIIAENLGAKVTKHDESKELTAQLDDPNKVVNVLDQLKENNIKIANISVQEPSMDDVFFALTGSKN